jgi:hypothetical protein
MKCANPSLSHRVPRSGESGTGPERAIEVFAELPRNSNMNKQHAQHILLALLVICALIAVYEAFL